MDYGEYHMRRRRRGNLGLVSLFALAAGCGDDTVGSFHANCTPGQPSAAAILPAGDLPGQPGAKVLIDGRLLTPSGTQMPLGGFPLAMRLVGDGKRFLAVSDGA